MYSGVFVHALDLFSIYYAYFVFVAGLVVNEYCSSDNFHPVCSGNKIIVLTRAIYGRMKVGRCLDLDMEELAKQNQKYFGCSDDVLDWMDTKCSGKAECNVGVYDQQLKQKSSCFRDLEKYLEASYICVSGKLLTPSDFYLNYRKYICSIKI